MDEIDIVVTYRLRRTPSNAWAWVLEQYDPTEFLESDRWHQIGHPVGGQGSGQLTREEAELIVAEAGIVLIPTQT